MHAGYGVVFSLVFFLREGREEGRGVVRVWSMGEMLFTAVAGMTYVKGREVCRETRRGFFLLSRPPNFVLLGFAGNTVRAWQGGSIVGRLAGRHGRHTLH